LLAVPQDSRQALAAHVRADFLDDLLRTERAAEHLDRPLPTALADHIASGTEFFPQGVKRLLDTILPSVDSRNIQAWWSIHGLAGFRFFVRGMRVPPGVPRGGLRRTELNFAGGTCIYVV
jgi:hypothetical protein